MATQKYFILTAYSKCFLFSGAWTLFFICPLDSQSFPVVGNKHDTEESHNVDLARENYDSEYR